MTKSAVKLLDTNKHYKNGVLTGLVLAKQISKAKKQSKLKGGEMPVTAKKVLAALAGPWGWLWLAKHNSDKNKELEEKLKKYEPDPEIDPAVDDPNFDDDFPLDPDLDYDGDYDLEDMGKNVDMNDFELDDFE